MERGIGDNSRAFGQEEDAVPPKRLRIVDKERALQVLVATRLTAALFQIAKKRIREKRQGGEEGRALRRFLIVYARSLGSPVWECAEIFDLNRKQIGQEEQAYLDMLSRSPALEEDADHMTAMLDAGLRVQTGRFLQTSISEMQADAAAKKAIKLAQEATELLEKPLKEKPKRKLTEAERLVAEGQAKRAEAQRQQRIAICKAVIIKGGSPGASKEARADAKRAIKELDELMGL